MKTFFTIVTPTFNREDLVQRTIKSILAQTYTNWELIVVDDGSTDNTEKVIQKYLSDSRIKYVKKENTGQADSLNVGVSFAKGDFITFLDSDDEAYYNWLEVVNEEIKEDTGIACVGAIRKLTDGRMWPENLTQINWSGEKARVKFTCGSLFIRRSIFNAIGGYDAKLKSDIQTDLGLRLLAYLKSINHKIASIDQNLVQINIHSGPRIRTSWEYKRSGSIYFYHKHYDLFRKYHPSGLSSICSSIAFSNYKLKKRGEAARYMLKAIKHDPLRLTNYLRFFKYRFL